MMKKPLTWMLIVCVSGGYAADTWWVKADGGTDAAGYGTSESTPFKTLQYAHDAAAAGDTIKVLPGEYDEGYGVDVSVTGYSHTNRLWVTKTLHFESTGGAAVTTIRGRLDNTAYGYGPAGIRCVACKNTAVGSTFKGFTFADGGGGNGSDEDLRNYGGGFGVDSSFGYQQNLAPGSDMFRFYLTDCVFTNCVAKWGGGMRGGTAIRCLFVDNCGDSFGQAACSAALWNCLVRRTRNTANTGRPLFGNGARVVNCTVYDSTAQGANHVVSVFNTVFVNVRTTLGYHVTSEENTYDRNYSDESSNPYITAKNTDLLVSPETGDFRLCAGTDAVGGASAEYVTNAIVLPADIEMKDYAGNPIDLTKPVLDAGCIQGAVTPGTGRLKLPAGTSVNGGHAALHAGNVYARTDVWPRQLRLAPAVASDTFMRYKLGAHLFYLQYDGCCWIVPPHEPYESKTIEVQYASQVLWADPDADASVADGSEEKPFRTLQAAMDHVAANPAMSIIYARPGDYAEGGAWYNAASNRVVFPASSAILLKSTGGAAVTTIYGKADPDGAYPVNYPGCGTNAMRCVTTQAAASPNQAIQGFTLADGHGSVTEGSYLKDAVSDRVGGLYGSNYSSFQALDCVFTNCTAVRGGAFYNVFASRCVLDDCVSYGGVTRYSILASCVVKPTCRCGTGPSGASVNSVIGTDTRLVFSTVIGASMGAQYSGGAGFAEYFCSLFGDQSMPGSCYWGSVFRNPAGIGAGGYGYAVADPCFLDYGGGDYRVPASSPARYAAVMPGVGADKRDAFIENVWYFAGGGIDGKPISVSDDGVPMPGAYQGFAPGAYVYLDDAAGALSLAAGGTDIQEGMTSVAENADLTIAQDLSVARPAAGFTLNGATNIFSELPGRTLTVPYATLVAEGANIAPVYVSEWYVDAVNGDDMNNDGCSKDRPKKTLASVLAAATVAGDVVHAAAGDYNEGKMYHAEANSASPASRAVILPGVSLVSDEGADATFITGASADEENADQYGRGTNAVRCVFMRVGAHLKGFTLRGGRTRRMPSGGTFEAYTGNADFLGGGVYSPGWNGASYVDDTRVEDCVVSNCVSLVGGAGHGVTFDRCRLLHCRAQRGSAVERCGLVNTVVDEMDSEGGSGICANDLFRCVNVTIGRNIRGDSGASFGYFRQTNADYGMTNTVIMSGYWYTGLTNAVNCVFVNASANVGSGGLATCRKATVAEIALDGDYRPDRATSVLVDAGATSGVAGDADALGGQRVYNGSIDIGAVESDWRGRYAKVLGAGGISVDAADPLVVEDGGAVCITNGSVVVTWTNTHSPKTVQLRGSVQVTGTGTLSITVDGGEPTLVTSADGVRPFELKTSSAATEWIFAYTPGENDTGCAILSGFIRARGLVISLR